eukprot:4262213-Prymnesium_polylepis.1
MSFGSWSCRSGRGSRWRRTSVTHSSRWACAASRCTACSATACCRRQQTGRGGGTAAAPQTEGWPQRGGAQWRKAPKAAAKGAARRPAARRRR